MKTKLTSFLFLLFAFATIQTKSQTLIQYWDFNQVVPYSGSGGDSLGTVYSYNNSFTMDTAIKTGTLYANHTAPLLTVGHIVYSRPTVHYSSIGDSIIDGQGPGGSFIYDYSSDVAYFSTSDSGNSEGNAYLKVRNPSDSAEVYMFIPTTGYDNIQLHYVISQSSTKGAQFNIFSYSTNGGNSWKSLTRAMDTFNISAVYRPDTLQVENPTTSAGTWYPVQINFTSDPLVNNNPNFILKWRMAGINTSTGTSGNDRYDNFAVLGTVATSANNLPAHASGYNVYPNPVQNVVNIVSDNYTGDKVMTLYNVVGQTISVTENKGKQTAINTSSLTSGVYFIEIKEASTGNKYTVKIVKD